WSAATALSWRRHGHDPRRHLARARTGPGPAHGVPGGRRAVATPGAEAERGAVRAAAAGGGVLFRHVPHRGRVPARLDRARVRDGDHMLFEFCAFAGGMAAWAGSRERRRK